MSRAEHNQVPTSLTTHQQLRRPGRRLLAGACVLGALLAAANVGAEPPPPSDAEFIALHVALAQRCPALMPAQAAEVGPGAAVLLCDVTQGSDEQAALFRQVQSQPGFAALLGRMNETVDDSPELCESLLAYAGRGRYCEWVPGAGPGELPRAQRKSAKRR